MSQDMARAENRENDDPTYGHVLRTSLRVVKIQHGHEVSMPSQSHHREQVRQKIIPARCNCLTATASTPHDRRHHGWRGHDAGASTVIFFAERSARRTSSALSVGSWTA
jgi:hypothetical protein